MSIANGPIADTIPRIRAVRHTRVVIGLAEPGHFAAADITHGGHDL
jgi:hypothetical protein